MEKNMKSCDVAPDDDLLTWVSTDLGEQIGNLSLADTIDQNYLILIYLFEHSQIRKSFDDFKINIIERIDNGQITNDWISETWMDHQNPTYPDPHLVPIELSCIYSILAERTLERGESDKGWAFVAKACYLCGLAEVSIDDASQNNVPTRQENSSKGGLAKAKKHNSAKEEAIRLLNAPPEDGWVNETHAIDSIKIGLDEFKIKNGIMISTTIKDLLRWLSEPAISAAFEANKLRVPSNNQS